MSVCTRMPAVACASVVEQSCMATTNLGVAACSSIYVLYAWLYQARALSSAELSALPSVVQYCVHSAPVVSPLGHRQNINRHLVC